MLVATAEPQCRPTSDADMVIAEEEYHPYGRKQRHLPRTARQTLSTTQDMHRALVSLQEELEAVDWYQQRADACEDAELKAILLHNMREEIEHASMVLEWLRRNHPDFEKTPAHLSLPAEADSGDRGVDQASNGKAAPNAGRPPAHGTDGWDDEGGVDDGLSESAAGAVWWKHLEAHR